MLWPLLPAAVLSCAPDFSGDAPQAAIAPAALAAGERGYRSDWSGVPEGRAPAEFVHVAGPHAWLYDGGWRIERQGGRAVLAVPFAKTVPPEPLSFRRYAGDAFGPDGSLPVRYRIEAEATSLGGSMRFGGYGELAIQACYLSPVRYVEVLQTDRELVIWEATDAPPGTGKGWKALARVPHPVAVGDWVRFGAEVDRARGTFTALLDGEPVATARSGLISEAAPARFTIRATGNREAWRWVTARKVL